MQFDIDSYKRKVPLNLECLCTKLRNLLHLHCKGIPLFKTAQYLEAMKNPFSEKNFTGFAPFSTRINDI